MQEAVCSRTNGVYTALELEGMDAARRSVVASDLRCGFCGENAHYRSRSQDGRTRPCFYCRPHGENCQITVQESDPWGDDDEGRINHRSASGARLIVSIPNQSRDSSGDMEVAESLSDERTRSGSAGGRSVTGDLRRGPRRILELLTQSNTFRTSSAEVRLPDGNVRPVYDAFVNFSVADVDLHTDGERGFWGVLPSPTFWAHGGAWYFNFGVSERSFRVSISNVVMSQILERYGVGSARELAGRTIIFFDRARVSTTDRFTADVISFDRMALM